MCVPMYSAAGQRGHPKARVFNNKFFGYGSKKQKKIDRKDKEGNQTQMERIANKISPVATSVSRAVATITTGRTTLKSRNH